MDNGWWSPNVAWRITWAAMTMAAAILAWLFITWTTALWGVRSDLRDAREVLNLHCGHHIGAGDQNACGVLTHDPSDDR